MNSDDGPGKPFLAPCATWSRKSSKGDFDQIELYTAKLNELEAFVAQQAKQDVQTTIGSVGGGQQRGRPSHPAALHDAVAGGADACWRWKSTFATSWRRSGVKRWPWASSAMAFQSELAQRLKRVARDLVMSVQPKGSPAMRKKFLMQLPR